MRNTRLEEAGKLAERLRLIIEESDFNFDNEKIPVTLSLGAAAIDDNLKNIDVEDENGFVVTLISNADAKLYQAKQRGRNRVCY
jgi:diguanylate cyclase (GGDEF)-like protein